MFGWHWYVVGLPAAHCRRLPRQALSGAALEVTGTDRITGCDDNSLSEREVPVETIRIELMIQSGTTLLGVASASSTRRPSDSSRPPIPCRETSLRVARCGRWGKPPSPSARLTDQIPPGRSFPPAGNASRARRLDPLSGRVLLGGVQRSGD